MKMNRYLRIYLLGLVVGMLPLFGAKADEQMLYWMIDESNQYAFDYAIIYVAPSANFEGKSWTVKNGYSDVEGTRVLPNGDGVCAYFPKDGSHTTTLEILTGLGDENWAAYSFYIELLQWDTETESEIRTGVSEVSTYIDLTANHHILGSGLTIPDNLVVWSPHTTPEPTGVHLILIGLGVLAMRRKKAGEGT